MLFVPGALRGSVRAMPGGDVPVTDLGARGSVRGYRALVQCSVSCCLPLMLSLCLVLAEMVLC
jgi:hypothetical protein